MHKIYMDKYTYIERKINMHIYMDTWKKPYGYMYKIKKYIDINISIKIVIYIHI